MTIYGQTVLSTLTVYTSASSLWPAHCNLLSPPQLCGCHSSPDLCCHATNAFQPLFTLSLASTSPSLEHPSPGTPFPPASPFWWWWLLCLSQAPCWYPQGWALALFSPTLPRDPHDILAPVSFMLMTSRHPSPARNVLSSDYISRIPPLSL